MMTADIITAVLAQEGGFVDNPDDHGGPTNFGITIPDLSGWLGRPATRDDIVALTQDTARTIYEKQYVVAPGFAFIMDDDLRALAVDCGVLHGPVWPIRWMQALVGLPQDGIFGPASRANVNHQNPLRMRSGVCAARIKHIGAIISHDPTQAQFAAGWLSRAAGFVESIA